MAYNVTAEWRKGSQNDAPDALPCNPVQDPQPQDMLAEYNCQSTSNVHQGNKNHH